MDLCVNNSDMGVKSIPRLDRLALGARHWALGIVVLQFLAASAQNPTPSFALPDWGMGRRLLESINSRVRTST